MMKRKLKKPIRFIILLLPVLILFMLFYTSFYIYEKFDNIPFSQLLYTVKHSEGTNTGVVNEGLLYVVPRVLLSLLVIYLLQKIIFKRIHHMKRKPTIRIPLGKREFRYRFFDFTMKKRVVLYCALCIVLAVYTVKQFRIGEYFYYITKETKIFDEYYVNPRDVNVTFEGQKRNLIYIIVESEEMTNASIRNGGGVYRSYIPNLEYLALNNTNFSNTDCLGGALMLNGTTYTASSLIAQTSGSPLVSSMNGNEYTGYSSSYPGLYTIGQVLEKNGYANYFMLGSDSTFGGRGEYFVQHGNYKVMDYNYAKKHKWIDKDYEVWWGFEDKKLFQFAENELTEIAESGQPFNFTLLTADSHFTDGYYDETCGAQRFNDHYASVFYCNDQMIYDFVEWVQEQDFYENTTIVITGDHLTMQGDFYSDLDEDYQRTIYTTIINSAIDNPTNTKNRLYSVLDLYPTTLASLGANIEGETLGFGVNLYSNKETLIERLGFDYLNKEFSKSSPYFNNNILGNTYYEVNAKSEE